MIRPEDLAYSAYKERPCNDTQDALYRAVVSQAKTVIYLILHQERMDLATNTATRIVLNLEQFDGRSAFSTWSHRIAMNVAYDAAYEMNRRKENSLTDLAEEHMPLDTGLDGYAAVLLEDINKTLDKMDQKLLEGKMFGLSYEELSEQLDITEEAVRQRWCRLKETIAQKLTKRS